MKQTSPDINRLHELIERYFDATATEAEEAEMRRGLADMSLNSPRIDEARAVTGFFAVERQRQRRAAAPRQTVHWPRIAAAIAVAAVCGAALLTIPRHSDAEPDRCVAYVGDTEITDSQEVLAIMRSNLDELGEASADMRDDVNSQLSILATELSL